MPECQALVTTRIKFAASPVSLGSSTCYTNRVALVSLRLICLRQF